MPARAEAAQPRTWSDLAQDDARTSVPRRLPGGLALRVPFAGGPGVHDHLSGQPAGGAAQRNPCPEPAAQPDVLHRRPVDDDLLRRALRPTCAPSIEVLALPNWSGDRHPQPDHAINESVLRPRTPGPERSSRSRTAGTGIWPEPGPALPECR